MALKRGIIFTKWNQKSWTPLRGRSFLMCVGGNGKWGWTFFPGDSGGTFLRVFIKGAVDVFLREFRRGALQNA